MANLRSEPSLKATLLLTFYSERKCAVDFECFADCRFPISTRKDIVLPLGKPVKSADGKRDIQELYLKNNTNIAVGISAVNRDPAIWGMDATLWNPERWLVKDGDSVAKERLPGVFSGMCVTSHCKSKTLLSSTILCPMQDDLLWGLASVHVSLLQLDL